MGYYSNGDEYCDRRRCRNLNHSRQPVRPVDDIDGLDACDRHIEDTKRNIEDLLTLVENGICPWCDDYSGENVGHHASSAHPHMWNEYSERKA